jgi:hypothetical protein
LKAACLHEAVAANSAQPDRAARLFEALEIVGDLDGGRLVRVPVARPARTA